jgi:hypothetical protein
MHHNGWRQKIHKAKINQFRVELKLTNIEETPNEKGKAKGINPSIRDRETQTDGNLIENIFVISNGTT